MHDRTRSREDRFWSLVDVREPDDCWLWTGSRYTNGYGRTYWPRPSTPAHRVAMLLSHVPLPAGVFVCHRCDVPLCCNPSHLFLGTHKQNMEDAKAKGRNAHGERHYRTSLTAAQVLDARKRWATAEVKEAELATELGMSTASVRRMLKGQSWASVPLVERVACSQGHDLAENGYPTKQGTRCRVCASIHARTREARKREARRLEELER